MFVAMSYLGGTGARVARVLVYQTKLGGVPMRKDYVHIFVVPHTRHLSAVERSSRNRPASLSVVYLTDKYDVRDFLCPDEPDLPSVRAVLREQAMNRDFY